MVTQTMPADTTAGARDRQRARAMLTAKWVLGFTAAVGVANVLVLLAQGTALIHTLNLNSDVASAYVLPVLAGHAPAGSIVNLGNHAWYETWWFERLTDGLPGYRELWEVAPFILAFLGIAAIAACAAWAIGWPAAVVSAVVLVSAGDTVREYVFAPEARVQAILHVGLMCGALLFVLHRAQTRWLSRRALLTLSVPVVAINGAGATDQLIVLTGLAAYVLAPLLCWWWDRSVAARRVALFALVTGILSLLVGVVLTSVMQGEHIVHSPFPVDFVGASGVFTNLQNLIASFTDLGGGDFFGGPVSGTNIYVFALGVLLLFALAVALRAFWRWAFAGHATTAQAARCNLYVAFWSLVLVLAIAVFTLTSISGTGGDSHYLLTGYAALAALVASFATVGAIRIAVALGVCVFGILTARGHIADGVLSGGVGPDQQIAGQIEHFALAHGADIGYGAYWDAAVVTWESDLRLKVYPIEGCASGPGECVFSNNYISSWYVPQSHIRSILLTDSNPSVLSPLVAPPPAWGHPIAQAIFGTVYVFVFNHDIASNLGPT